jgi:hypothetical protein
VDFVGGRLRWGGGGVCVGGEFLQTGGV